MWWWGVGAIVIFNQWSNECIVEYFLYFCILLAATDLSTLGCNTIAFKFCIILVRAINIDFNLFSNKILSKLFIHHDNSENW